MNKPLVNETNRRPLTEAYASVIDGMLEDGLLYSEDAPDTIVGSPDIGLFRDQRVRAEVLAAVALGNIEDHQDSDAVYPAALIAHNTWERVEEVLGEVMQMLLEIDVKAAFAMFQSQAVRLYLREFAGAMEMVEVLNTGFFYEGKPPFDVKLDEPLAELENGLRYIVEEFLELFSRSPALFEGIAFDDNIMLKLQRVEFFTRFGKGDRPESLERFWRISRVLDQMILLINDAVIRRFTLAIGDRINPNIQQLINKLDQSPLSPDPLGLLNEIEQTALAALYSQIAEIARELGHDDFRLENFDRLSAQEIKLLILLNSLEHDCDIFVEGLLFNE